MSAEVVDKTRPQPTFRLFHAQDPNTSRSFRKEFAGKFSTLLRADVMHRHPDARRCNPLNEAAHRNTPPATPSPPLVGPAIPPRRGPRAPVAHPPPPAPPPPTP